MKRPNTSSMTFHALDLALHLQWIVGAGFTITLFIAIFLLKVNDPRYPTENLIPLLTAIGLCMLCVIASKYLIKTPSRPISLKEGSLIITFTWIISCTISAIYFVQSGFPNPSYASNINLLSRFIDGWYESMSGFTTTGASILPTVEVFPRSLLFWRAFTHWIGGMGIAYMAVTLWKNLPLKRQNIINSESESPTITTYDDEQEAIHSGYNFLKVYCILTLALFILLLISGHNFRTQPYLHWYDNAYESLSYTFSTMGTGGFGVHDASEGLPIMENNSRVIGGLRNPVSDWIIGIFMVFAGMNFGVWYIIFFHKNPLEAFKNREFKVYLIYCISVTLAIWFFLVQGDVYPNIITALRYSLFNMATIVSTTGLANWDFHYWPPAAQGILFVCYLVGGSVGSTAGGLKVSRFLIVYQYLKQEILYLGDSKHKFKPFEIDGTLYDHRAASLTAATVGIYYFIFLASTILLMITSSHLYFIDGTVKTLDFSAAVSSAIANLGNIGPAVAIGNINAGPTGNYAAISPVGKIILILLMYIGRVGVITFLMLFVTNVTNKSLNRTTHHYQE